MYRYQSLLRRTRAAFCQWLILLPKSCKILLITLLDAHHCWDFILSLARTGVISSSIKILRIIFSDHFWVTLSHGYIIVSIDQVSSEYPKNTLIISRVFSMQTPSFLEFCHGIDAFFKKKSRIIVSILILGIFMVSFWCSQTCMSVWDSFSSQGRVITVIIQVTSLTYTWLPLLPAILSSSIFQNHEYTHRSTHISKHRLMYFLLLQM